MSRKELKKHGKLLLGKNNYWLNVVVAFFMTINIDSIILIFTTNYKVLFSLFTPSNFSLENIKLFILNNHGNDSFADIIVSIVAMLIEVLVIYIFRVGGARYFLKSRGNHPVKFSEIFFNFKDKTAGNIATVSFVKFLFCMLWTFVFIVPGVIKAYQYAAVEYILALRPDVHATEALGLSKKLMKGHKFEFFILQFSFIGWNILDLCTFGILGYLYLTPYKETTYIEFFCKIKEEAIEKETITLDELPDYTEATQTV